MTPYFFGITQKTSSQYEENGMDAKSYLFCAPEMSQKG